MIRVLLAPVIATALIGCRGRAQRDLYEAKMVHEIRVLEDQLYEADYQNRILIDKLEQVRLKSEAAPKRRSSDTTSSYGSGAASVPREALDRGETSTPEPLRDPGSSVPPSTVPPDLPELGPTMPPPGGKSPGAAAAPPDLDTLDGIDAMVDEGQPVDPSQLPDLSTSDPFIDDAPKASPEQGKGGDAKTLPAVPDSSEASSELLPAPGGPEPPSKRDTEVPPVLPGEVLPPSALDAEEDKPPGQIVLPDAAQQGAGIPDHLRIHGSLSGGDRVDGKIENMKLVINVLDQLGRPLELQGYDVDAELSIVMYDAGQQETDEAKLGRWDFSSEQVVDLIQSEPISGLHVPITWQGRQPVGDEVVVHVRVRAEEDEMRCQGRIKVQRANAVAEWTPRGEALK